MRDAGGKWLPGASVNPATQFPKGKSGNPGGRTKRVKEIRELALSETEASFRVLFAIRDNASEDSRARIAACKEIIRYGIGEARAVETEATPTDDGDGLTIEELRNLARQSLADEGAADDDADDGDETEH